MRKIIEKNPKSLIFPTFLPREKILPLGNLSKCTWKCTWLSRINAPGYAPNEQNYPQ